MSAGSLRVDNIDVFCEQGVFDLSSTRSILQAGKDMGLNINFHGDELHPMNSAQVSLPPEAVFTVLWPLGGAEELLNELKTTSDILCFYYVVHFIHMSEGRLLLFLFLSEMTEK